MSICLVSAQASARMLRLKELIETVTGEDVYYVLLPDYINVHLSEHRVVVLCSPFNGVTMKCVKDQLKGTRLIIDVDPQYNIMPPLITNGELITAPTKDVVDFVATNDTARSLLGAPKSMPIYKNSQLTNGNILVDLNYIYPEDIKKLDKKFKISAMTIGQDPGISRFHGLNFHRAIVAQELDDIAMFKDCKYALYTTARINDDLIIPDTMVDCMLMGIPILVDWNLEAACKFVVDHNCGYVITRENLKEAESIIETFRPVDKLENTFDFNTEELTIQAIMKGE